MVTQESLAARRTEHARLLEQSLQAVVAALSALGEVERVSLCGSYARGRADLFTDLDILVVMRTEDPFPERLRRLYGMLDVPVALDLLCYRPEELGILKDRPFFKRLLQDEVLLYEKNCS